ncbi:DUF551 domain-containing protein [Escherichia coli]|uniref:DUF551 domain-containing protein n=2 Tax=Enterobacteriaceae TaxID=543 RepID=UPI0035B55153
MWDSERKDIDAPGYYRTEHLVFAESSVNQWGGRVVPLYTAPPAPVALAVLERLQSIVADPRALPRRKEWVSGQQYSYVLLENVEAMVDEACRTAMIHGAEPVSQTYKLNELSGNSPVTPDSWISCSDRMPNDAQWCVVNTEYGYYVQCWSEGQGWLGDDISIPKCDVINWMPLPEPPQEVK